MILKLFADRADLDQAGRVDPAPTFDTATAGVEEALSALRAAEEELESQLADLRNYLRVGPAPSCGGITEGT